MRTNIRFVVESRLTTGSVVDKGNLSTTSNLGHILCNVFHIKLGSRIATQSW